MVAQTSERTRAAQMKTEADAAAAARIASTSKAASDARITDLERSRDYYKVCLPAAARLPVAPETL